MEKNDFLWNRILRYISKRERCVQEIENFLKIQNSKFKIQNYSSKLKINNSREDEIISKLKALDFLNEERYVKAYVHDSFELKNKGKCRIAQELKNKGIDELTINKYLGKINKDDLEEKAVGLARRKYALIKNLPVLTIKRRLYGQLVRRGFSPEIAMHVIDTVLEKR